MQIVAKVFTQPAFISFFRSVVPVFIKQKQQNDIPFCCQW